MKILIFNCGSSSLSFKIIDITGEKSFTVPLSGKAHRVGVEGEESSFIEVHSSGTTHREVFPISNHRKASEWILNFLITNKTPIDIIGHRFVHGGNHFKKTTKIDKDTLLKLEECIPLAPIHNPISLSVIHESHKKLPDITQYVTFDSAFHSTIPLIAYTYPLPKKIIDRFGFRKYGFHGLSYSFVSKETAFFLKKPIEKLKVVACHLGTGGSSVAAIKFGKSADTSMGYSPLSGLVMSTRCGDIDPMLAIFLMIKFNYRTEEFIELLNKKSGLLGLSGFSSDIRDIIGQLSSEEKNQSELAFRMYIHRLKKYIGSYITAMEGIDAIVFTDDIGLKNPFVREQACRGMEWCGIILDKKLNENVAVDKICDIKAPDSDIHILTIPTDEEYIIAYEGLKLMKDVK